MYIVLTGAKQNAGDFLITERCKALLRKYKPDDELVQLPVWESLANHLDLVNTSKGIIIMGGPGYRYDMYPDIYKLTPDLNDIQVPIIPLGVGWKGASGNLATIRDYHFSEESLRFLRRITSGSKYLSCRDYHTWQVLRDHGFSSALMTGCPAWYDLNYIGASFQPPAKIETLAFTPSAYFPCKKQSVDIARVLKTLFPSADIVACFHHGFEYSGLSGNESFFENQRVLRDVLQKMGIRSKDLSGDVKKMDYYKKCDLHVGYRVHAHIHFLSRRRASILIYEDGRGAGVDDALRIPGIDGLRPNPMRVIPYGLYRRLGRKRPRGLGLFRANEKAPELLRRLLERECHHDFVTFSGIGRRIDKHYEILVQFLESF